MPYRIVDHTADLRVIVEGNSLEHLFNEALRCLMEILFGKAMEGKPKVRRPLSVTSPDPTSLLVDFLNEALAQSTIHREIYTGVRFKKFSKTALEAELAGRKADAFAEDIKAVTYHEAAITESDGVFKTKLVFDI